MTTDRDLERLLDTWFADGPTQVADRVIDGMADRIGRQGQRPAWRLQTWRFPAMSTPLKLVLLAAALVAVVLAGTVLVAGGRGSGPVVPPSPTPVPPALGDGPVQHQDYLVRTTPGFVPNPVSFTFTAPAGWSASGGWALTGPADSGAPGGTAVDFTENPPVAAAPCAPQAGNTPEVHETVDSLVTALQGYSGGTVTGLADVTVDGHPAKRLDLQLPASLPCQQYYVFGAPAGTYAHGQSNHWRIWIFDVGGGNTVAITVSDYAGTSAADKAAAQSIVDSLHIDP